MKFIPQRDWYLVKPVAIQSTKSGLILVDGKLKEGPETPTLIFGEVLKGPDNATGFWTNENGVDIETAHIGKGTVVAFHPTSMIPASIPGEERLGLVKLNQIYAVIEDFSPVVDVLKES